MGTMSTMGRKGDVRVSWDPDNSVETEVARKTFAENVKKGFAAFKMTAGGKKGTQIKEFDAFAESILFIPPVQGG